MGLVFPFRPVPIPHPAVALGGRLVRPRPITDVSLVGPGGTVVREALIDTGSDDTVFEDRDAVRLGIDLNQAATNSVAGIGSGIQLLRYARVVLRLTDGSEFREWPAWVGFTSTRLSRGLLGYAGCLQFFSATFHGDRERVELAVNPLYPGT